MSLKTGTISTATGNVTLAIDRALELVLVTVHGTYGTFAGIFEASNDNAATYYTVQGNRISDGTLESAPAPSNNSKVGWYVRTGAATQVRLRATALASGSVSVQITSVA
jgi:hypothetical protein